MSDSEKIVSFSPSTNISRDDRKSLDYVVTKNARSIYDQIFSNVKTGQHSFNIIGSYGTGKTTFLLALKQHLRQKQIFFRPLSQDFDKAEQEFHITDFVGDYSSLQRVFAQYLNTSDDSSSILKRVDSYYQELAEEGKYWIILLDEFGKHLEYASKESPDKELYFLQQLAEYVNESDKQIFLISTLHQGFDSYARGLTLEQQKEWEKVKGRYKEVAFNEPVEQLLFIAGRYLQNVNSLWGETDKAELLNVITKSHAFPLKNRLDETLIEDLYPLEPLAASVLALALQKYGQNERSLFSFLNSAEIKSNIEKESFDVFGISNVFDYLLNNYHSFLSSKDNSHYIQWNSIKRSLERVEAQIDDHFDTAQKLIKTIGLLNLFAGEGAKVNRSFLSHYFELSTGREADEIHGVLEQLEKHKIIRFRSYKDQFILFEGTDLDIEYELRAASSKVDPVKDIVRELRLYFDFPLVPAKRSFYNTGTPRFFEFKLSSKALDKSPEQPIDGFVNLVFEQNVEDVLSLSSELNVPVLYAVFENTEQISIQLHLIKKVDYLIEKVVDLDDKVARRELNNYRKESIRELNELLRNQIYEGHSTIKWIFNGQLLEINGIRDFNVELSAICEKVYHKTPVFKNELINRESVSPAIYKPRKELLRNLIGKSEEEDLGFDSDTFPAEKTIYLSLLKRTGIHRETDGEWQLGAPDSRSGLETLWEASEQFFESTKSGKRPITDLMDILIEAPYGLKGGMIELWVPIYFYIKKDDCAIFKSGSYITQFEYDIANLLYRNPKLFEVKAFHLSDVKKNIFTRYRSFLNKSEDVVFSNESFVDTVKPFLLIFNNLNNYGRTNKKISREAQKLRDAFRSATDPEEAFFEQFITALGYPNVEALNDEEALHDFVMRLDKTVDEIKYAYKNLIDRTEEVIFDAVDLPVTSYSKDIERIRSFYGKIDEYELVPYQRKLVDRFTFDQPSRQKWIEAVAFAVLDKPLERIKDQEEHFLFKRLKDRIDELNHLVDLSKLSVDKEKEEPVRLTIETFGNEPQNKQFRVNKNIRDQELYQTLKKQLKGNSDNNLATLLALIEDLS